MQSAPRPIWATPVAIAAAMIALVFAADLGLAGPLFRAAAIVPSGDKLAHFVLFGTLSFAIARVLLARNRSPGAIAFWLTIVAAIATAEECTQIYIQYRSFEIADLIGDYLGITTAGATALAFHLHSHRGPGERPSGG